jgi:glycosyltransferase involved in cell wall biosynthesis
LLEIERAAHGRSLSPRHARRVVASRHYSARAAAGRQIAGRGHGPGPRGRRGAFRPGRRSAEIRRRHGLADRDFLLLYVGRVSAEKKLGRPPHGGVQGAIEHGVTGLLCEPSRPDDWEAAVGCLIENEHRRRLMARNARRYAERRDWAVLFDRLMSAYAQLAEGGSRDVAAVRR